MSLLEIKGLRVTVDKREIIKGVDLNISKGEIHVLMGPNACGKTSLALAIMGYPTYKITKGELRFKDIDLRKHDITSRARLGLGMAYQSPPEVRGVKLRDILRLIAGSPPWNPTEEKEGIASRYIEKVRLSVDRFLSRDLNLGFSGGERKRSELAQLFAQRPDLMILDEPDSGVDIDSLKLIGKEIDEFQKEEGCAVLIITHHRHILQYLRPNLCHIMYDGRIVDRGDPDCLIPCIESVGYEGFIERLQVCERVKEVEKYG
ncbi:MAG: Fe-S cluster assembly ATPase SufC [bacterium]|nr:Fe-S cluster assembly ATPase SufC [bacterium]